MINQNVHRIVHTIVFFILSCSAIIGLMFNKLSFEHYGVTKKNAYQSFKDGVLFSIPIIILSILLKYLITIIPNPYGYGQDVFHIPSRFHSFLPTFLIIVYGIFIYVQEFNFRGAALTALEEIFPSKGKIPWKAIMISNTLFGLTHIHQGWYFFIFSYIFGFYWTYIYLRTRNLIGASINHIIISIFPIVFLDAGMLLFPERVM